MRHGPRLPRVTMSEMHLRIRIIVACAAALAMAVWLAPAAPALTSSNNTPFPASRVLSGANWTSARHNPPPNQFGDILPTPWADDGNLYVLMDDGGTDAPANGALWRNSFAQITGNPLSLNFRRIGVSPPAATWSQIHQNRSLWTGPLGHYYSTGFAVVNHVFFATQDNNWNYNANAPFRGLAGIAYSTDRGGHWRFPAKPFPSATGNLNWVQWGRARQAPDGYVYAIASEREFNASNLILGRSRPDIADMTDPSRWQWASGTVTSSTASTAWSSQVQQATPILRWPNHITYPRMTYDPGLHRYLLSYTYSYAAKPPDVWRAGSELVIMEGPHPWGPFSFVTRGSYFGPSNGYDPAFPVKWISRNGLDMWMVWAANFDGCNRGLSCGGAYGFNYQRLHLNLAGPTSHSGGAAQTAAAGPPRPPAAWRGLQATPPRVRVPRLIGAPRG